jgi:hypothetical protein
MFTGLRARLQSCEKQLLALSRLPVSLSVCPSTWNNLVPTGRIFMKFDIHSFFRKSAQIVQVALKPGRNNGYFI